MTSFTRSQAERLRDKVLAHVGAIRIDKADPGIAAVALDALHMFLSFVSLFTGTYVDPSIWRRHWSQTIGIVVMFGTELSDDDVALVAAHEAVHVLQFKALGFRGMPSQGYAAAMWIVYVFSPEGRARLEAAGYGIMLEIGIKLLGWDRERVRQFILHVRDVSLPNYALALPERELVAQLLDSQATGLFSGTTHVSELGALCIQWGRELGVWGVVSRQAVTLWTGKGATVAFDDPASRALLDAARPQIIRIHTGPASLASDGAKLTARVRAAYPDAEAWWALAGDSNGPDPSRLWVRAAKAAVAAGVEVLELNCEQAWKTRPRGIARKAIEAVHAAAPTLTLGHTAYDGPVSILLTPPGVKPAKRWGGHSVYPWAEFIGAGSPVAFSSPQIYWASAGGETKARGAGAERLANHRKSWAAAQRQAMVRPDLTTHAYLQSYGCRTDELVTVGEQFAVTSWWATPTRLKPEGIAAIRALSELHRRGQTVVAFQRAAGLTPDGLCGPKTLAALLGS